MIIFGTKGRAIKMDSGTFQCPNCKDNKDYQKKYVQNWFTLYWIPIFPVGEKKDEHIECDACSNIYHTDVIDYKPGLNEKEIESEYQKALKHVLCLMIVADHNVDDKEGKLLMKTAGVLEMTPAHVKGVLSELDKNKSN